MTTHIALAISNDKTIVEADVACPSCDHNRMHVCSKLSKVTGGPIILCEGCGGHFAPYLKGHKGACSLVYYKADCPNDGPERVIHKDGSFLETLCCLCSCDRCTSSESLDLVEPPQAPAASEANGPDAAKADSIGTQWIVQTTQYIEDAIPGILDGGSHACRAKDGACNLPIIYAEDGDEHIALDFNSRKACVTVSARKVDCPGDARAKAGKRSRSCCECACDVCMRSD